MKKLINVIIALVFVAPVVAFATPTSWDFATGILQPLQSQWTAVVKASRFQATSTTASIFPYASTTAISTTNLCLTTDCRTTWPTGTVTSVTGTWPIVSSGGATPNISWTGLATTTAISVSQVLYATSVSGVSSVSTTTLTATTPLSLSNPVAKIGGSNSVLTIATTTNSLFTGTQGQVLAYTGSGWTGVATTTFSTGLTYAAGNVTCDTASASVFGCLASVSFSKFNSATTTFNNGITYSVGSAGLSAITQGVLGNIGAASAVPVSVATSSLFTGTAGQVDYFSDTGALVGTSTIFISTANNVGVGGQTSPYSILHVASSTVDNRALKNILTITANENTEGSTDGYSGSSASYGIMFRRNWTGGGASYGNQAAIYSYSQDTWRGGLIFQTKSDTTSGGAPATRMTITPAGLVGIGTASPGYTLEVTSGSNQTAKVVTTTTGSYGLLQVQNTNTNGEASIGFRDSSDSDEQSWVVGKSVGATDNLGFYYAGIKLLISTVGYITITAPAAAGVGATYICLSTGNVIQSGATCAASSKKVKNNIMPFANSLAKILALNPVSFNYNKGFYGGKQDVGFVAEDVAKVDPRFAIYDEKTETLPDGQVIKKGDPMALDTTAILSATVGAIQELNAKLEAQQKQIESLQTANTKLKAQLKTLGE